MSEVSVNDDIMSCSQSVHWLVTFKTQIAPAINWLIRSLQKVIWWPVEALWCDQHLRLCWLCFCDSCRCRCIYVKPKQCLWHRVLHDACCDSGWNYRAVGWRVIVAGCVCQFFSRSLLSFVVDFVSVAYWPVSVYMSKLSIFVLLPISEKKFCICICKHLYIDQS